MKRNFLVSAFLFFSLVGMARASTTIYSWSVVDGVKNHAMPLDFWSENNVCEFKTVEDAFNLAKINALCLGMEKPEDTVGVRSLCSGYVHIATQLTSFLRIQSRETTKLETEMLLLDDFKRECAQEEHEEGFAIQIIACELRKLIMASSCDDFTRYSKWLQYNKNPLTAAAVVHFINCYCSTKKDLHIQNLFTYLQAQVKRMG